MRYEPTSEIMSARQLIIVTGSVDSGKTSWCRELAAANPGCAGVMLLKVYMKGERIGYDALRLPAGDRLPFARVEGHEPSGWIVAQRVGPFSISSAGLKAANAWLIEAARQPVDIIVDEVGPLELAGGGFDPGLRVVLASPLQRKLYVTIRSDCVQAVCDRFGMASCRLVEIGTGCAKGGVRQSASRKKRLPDTPTSAEA
jgi:nucleoside-triphosphatase THEP1